MTLPKIRGLDSPVVPLPGDRTPVAQQNNAVSRISSVSQASPVTMTKPQTVNSASRPGLAVTGTNVDALLMLIGASALAGGGALVARRAARR